MGWKNLSVGWAGNNVIENDTQTIDLSKWNYRVPIVGPSGCGKSTLLYAISGMMDIQKGNINWQFSDGTQDTWTSGGNKTDDDRNELFLSRFSFSFQDSALLPHLSVEQNFAYPLELANEKLDYEFPSHQEQFQYVLDMVLSRTEKATDFLAKYPSQLSGGQRRRIAIAQALVTNPEIIFLDEPAGGLDPTTKINVMSKINDWVDAGAKGSRAVFWVTHHLDSAEFINCNNVLSFQSVDSKSTQEFMVTIQEPRDVIIA